MPLLIPPPIDVHRTKLLQAVKAKATAEDGIAEKTHQLIATATPLLDLIVAGPFKEFTLHNRDHPKKLVHIFEYLVPNETIERLSALECYVIVCAAYLHDLGMVLTSTERERLINSEDFQDSIREWPEIAEALDRTRAKLHQVEGSEKAPTEAIIFQLQEAALCRYLRPLHATPRRYSELIGLIKRNSGRADLFSIGGVSFEASIVDICESHNLDVGVLAEVTGTYDERFPRNMPVGAQRLNTQFCAALLRVCDILDFDRERTPHILFESLGIASRDMPGADITLREWQKHMAVTSLEIDDEELVVTGDCYHPVIERAVRDFCHLIERELRETNAVIQRNTEEICGRYVARLPITVRPRLRSIGYIFKDMTLRLNEPAIMSLLMGERLYSHPGAAVREMLQNSIDACHTRQMIEGEGQFQPAISLSHTTDSEGRIWLTVEDNGIGMDEYVINEFFLQAGTSYYRSAEFERLRAIYRNNTFTPISRFGIGVLAIFMVGDALELETRNTHSRRRDFMGRRLRIERLGGLAFVREMENDRVGTLIRVRLKPSFVQDLDQFLSAIALYVQSIVLRPRFPITLNLPTHSIILAEYRPFTFKKGAEQILHDRKYEIVILDLSRWSNHLAGSVALLFGLNENGMLSHCCNGRYLKFGNDGLRPALVLSSYSGNIITVNGFRMTLKKVSRILGGGRNSVSIAFDLDVTDSSDLTYHISRDRIVGGGVVMFKSWLREAVVKGMMELGILERLDPDTLAKLTQPVKQVFHRDFNLITHPPGIPAKPISPEDEEQILNRLPPDNWPQGIHRSIALELNMSPTQVGKTITRLIETGRVTNPNPKT